MKAKINYKSRKTIIIIVIAAILLLAAIGGTVAFMKGNTDTSAAMENSEGTSSVNGENNDLEGQEQNQNGENISENTEVELPVINGTEGNSATENNEEGNNATTNNNTGSGNAEGTTGTTNGNVPNQEYTQTTVQITEQPWEKTKIGWRPITVSAITTSSKLGIYKANLQKEKLVYVGNESMELPPVKTVAQKGDVLTYVIKVTNLSDIDATNVKIYDSIPEGTIYAENEENPISDNGKIENNELSWKIDVAKGETKAVFFKVIVTTDTLSLIDNTAKVDGEETNIVRTPIITQQKDEKIVVVDQNGMETLEDRDAKVGETIRYTITVTNQSEFEGKTNIYDIVPEGTTLVEDSISDEGKVETVEQDGQTVQKIVWENIEIAANGDTTVSFDVTINKEKLNKETNELEAVKNVKNIAVVGENDTNEVETKVANITTIKASIPSNEPLHELDTITYTLTSRNDGEGTGSVTITDEIPEGSTLASTIEDSDGNEYTVEELNNGIILTLTPGETKVITFTVSVDPFEVEEGEEAIKHIKNEEARQDGNKINETDDIVEKEYKTVSVEKIFIDKKNVDEVRPASVLVGLYRESEEEIVATEENAIETRKLTEGNLTATFENLDKYDLETKELITYTVKEINVDENYVDTYEVTTEGDRTTIKITNTLKYENVLIKETIAEKIWDDNDAEDRPESIKIAVYDGEDEIQAKDAEEGEDGKWKVIFENLPKYRENGEEITYTFDEINVPDSYVKTVNGNVITNALPRIQVVKTAKTLNGVEGSNITARAGDIVGYEIRVTNIGNITLNNVTVTDIPENGGKIFLNAEDVNTPEKATNTVISKEEGVTLVPNNSITRIVYYKVTEKDVENVDESPSLTNEAKAVGYYENSNGEEKFVEDDDPETIQFEIEEDASIVKTQKIGSINLSAEGKILNSNGKVTQNYPNVLPNTEIDYTITIENTGNTKLTNLIVTDVMNSDKNNTARNVTIEGVTVNNEPRTYTTNTDGSLSITGELPVDALLVVTASYTVKDTDVSDTESYIIENKATFKADRIDEKESKVELPTTEWKANIVYGKNGKLSDGTDADKATITYGDTITYTLWAKNTGTKAGTKTLLDTDIATMLQNGDITAPEKITVNHFDATTGKEKKEEITQDTIAELTKGITVNLPADETKVASVTFTVTVTAAPGTTISNAVVGKEDNPVETNVIGELEAVSKSYKGKNIVVVLDLSSSMLKVENENLYRYTTTNPDNYVDLLNASTETKLAKAKTALNTFISDVLENPANTITLITFNYDTKANAEKSIKYCADAYGENANDWPIKTAKGNTEKNAIKSYFGTQVLQEKTNDKELLTTAVNNIKLTKPLLTNVVAALEKTRETVNSLKSAEPNKDVEVVFIGDGKPSYSKGDNGYAEAGTVGSNGTSYGFYPKNDIVKNGVVTQKGTQTLIKEISNEIKYYVDANGNITGNKANIYTVEYAVPNSEEADAETTFTNMSSGSTYRYSATTSDLTEKLEAIGAKIDPPEQSTSKSDATGKVEIELKEGQQLQIGENTKVLLTISTKVDNKVVEDEMSFKSIDEINASEGGIIEYDESNKKFIIYMNKIKAGATVTLNYYYREN